MGEIDIIEGTNDEQFNIITLHTDTGCAVTLPAPMQGTLIRKDCCTNAVEYDGCGIKAPVSESVSETSFPTAVHDFNALGSGLYVTYWSSAGIKIYPSREKRYRLT
ncbi:glycoside hydrolase family 16 protein [Piedraia hortae CBS 480.64]|uniref:Glycoside hydrolase family 16 protein n=1 Tax=Piedraia hortae CBS 480.64 TaxID=1314780 RepID=A0A6A7BP94_9PEZI|nr:glycoside hydrolase family 16 protein [Piedraia hortae CBS 480.64]